MNSIDNFDLQILRILDTDGRMSYSAIAVALGVSNTMVHQRVARLTEHAILKGIKPVVDQKKLNYDWGAFVGLKVQKDYDLENIISQLERIPEITECYYVSGVTTLHIKMLARNQEHMRILLQRINNIQGVAINESIMELGCLFKRNLLL